MMRGAIPDRLFLFTILTNDQKVCNGKGGSYMTTSTLY
jgi:hypothetical protein